MFEISNIGILTAVAAGAISFLSPCVLPVVPGYISYIAGQTASDSATSGSSNRLGTLLLSFCFVLGFSTIFVALGAGASAISGVLLSYRYEANIVGGAIIILFGLFMMGLLRIPWMQRDLRFHDVAEGGRPVGAYILGLAFGFGWTPCIGPVLGTILAASALSDTASSGIALLGIYSVGLGLPFLATALFTEHVAAGFRRAGRIARYLHLGAGGIMIGMGLLMITGNMSSLAYWLIETFPALGRIG